MTQCSKFFEDWYKYIDEDILTNTLSHVEKDIIYNKVYPSPDLVFQAFLKCSIKDLKLVILGQDPYPQEGVATGLAFGNNIRKYYSPSLIVLEESINKYYNDLPYKKSIFPTLEGWAEQGVLLLNSSLTVRENIPGSHSLLWHPFIESFLDKLSSDRKDIVFLLFGNYAQSFIPSIHSEYIIKCIHPSYCARNKILLPNVFLEVDNLLIKLNKPPIYWK